MSCFKGPLGGPIGVVYECKQRVCVATLRFQVMIALSVLCVLGIKWERKEGRYLHGNGIVFPANQQFWGSENQSGVSGVSGELWPCDRAMTKEVSQDQSERMAKISSVSDLVASSSEVAHCDQLSTLLLTLCFNGCVEKKKKSEMHKAHWLTLGRSGQPAPSVAIKASLSGNKIWNIISFRWLYYLEQHNYE